MIRVLIRLQSFLAALCAASPALAGFASQATPSKSWEFRFAESGSGTPGLFAAAEFDTFAMQIVDENETFKDEAFYDFAVLGDNGGWYLHRQQSRLAVAHNTLGGFGGLVEFWTHLAGAFNKPLQLDYVAYAPSGLLLIAQRIIWDGLGNFSYGSTNWNPGRPNLLDNPVPVPAAVALGLIGLSLIGAASRRAV